MQRLALAQFNIAKTNKYIFHMRDGRAQISPHRLTWFGGQMKDSESSVRTIRRELHKEIILPLAMLVLTGPTHYDVPDYRSSSKELTRVHLFKAVVPESLANFEVKHGSVSEPYTNTEALERNDLSATVRFVLEQMLEADN
jgi:NUDIX domain